MQKIGALWLKETAKAGKFFSGELELTEGEKTGIMVFKNGYKEGNQPDYVVYLSEDPKPAAPAKKAPPISKAKGKAKPAKPGKDEPDFDDDSDIPF